LKSPQSQNHGFSSVQNRQPKAEKIRIVLDEYLSSNNKKKPSLLDIGTGSGDIADYLNDFFDVCSIDIKDQRTTKKAYTFLVANKSLLFKSNTFVIVISNHVLEHVQSPQHHINEYIPCCKTTRLALSGNNESIKTLGNPL
jgi:2-polyprenyl-3-methyl-5-hydroxy-6-metoxy-1,4-benzoquinol methylase